MKQPVRVLGLVRGRSYDALVEQWKKAEARASRLTQQLDEVRADSRSWKTKADEAQTALKKALEAATTAERNWRRAEKMREEAEKRGRLRDDRAAELATLRQHLVESEQELTIAREQLMAIEVKLDILEGAANVLDARTRDILRRAGSDDGAAV